MEEYDADIQFHFIKMEDGSLRVTTDIDDQIEYLEPEERAVIIVNLIKDLFEQLFRDIDDVDEEIEADIYNKICYKTQDIRDELISTILNLHYNSYAKHTKEKPKLLEYSMAIYETMYNKLSKDTVNCVVSTAYSNNITSIEPMNGAMAFTLDVAENLLDNGFPKDIVKQIVDMTINNQKTAVYDFIKQYEEDKEDE